MPIDFHHERNTNTYASRGADESWLRQMQALFDGSPIGRVADIGCGGGIYSRAWKSLGATSVVGLDSSPQMVADATAITDDAAISFAVASAYEIGMPDSSCDIVFSRAVIHHLEDHTAAFTEAFRVLAPGGMVIVQDRTIEDVLQPASANHIRAHFFTAFPRLLEEERRRRPETEGFSSVLVSTGFEAPVTESFWETRKIYNSPEELRADLLARTGRSILHDLNDRELASLTDTILDASDGHYPLEERDRWTMWVARKPRQLRLRVQSNHRNGAIPETPKSLLPSSESTNPLGTRNDRTKGI